METFWLGLIAGIVISVAVFIILGRIILRRWFERFKNTSMQRELEALKQKQRAVIKGQVSEQVFPLLTNEIKNLSDARFIGDPVDYIVFDGLSDESQQNPIRIRFIEVKTGSSQLNRREEKVKDAILDKRVEWKEIKL